VAIGRRARTNGGAKATVGRALDPGRGARRFYTPSRRQPARRTGMPRTLRAVVRPVRWGGGGGGGLDMPGQQRGVLSGMSIGRGGTLHGLGSVCGRASIWDGVFSATRSRCRRCGRERAQAPARAVPFVKPLLGVCWGSSAPRANPLYSMTKGGWTLVTNIGQRLEFRAQGLSDFASHSDPTRHDRDRRWADQGARHAARNLGHQTIIERGARQALGAAAIGAFGERGTKHSPRGHFVFLASGRCRLS